jgi:hypothetical protein
VRHRRLKGTLELFQGTNNDGLTTEAMIGRQRMDSNRRYLQKLGNGPKKVLMLILFCFLVLES